MAIKVLPEKRFMNRILTTRCGFLMSQEKLAEKVGVSRQTINAIESGKQIPSVFVALKLAEALDSTVDDLFFFTKRT